MHDDAVIPGTSEVLRLLNIIAAEITDSPSRVAFGGAGVEQVLEDWPVIGHRRLVARDRSAGGEITLAANTATDLLPAQPARGGLNIVVTGNTAVTVYGARAGDADTNPDGLPQLWLPASGGTWNGKISDEPWCGPVSLFATGQTTVAWWTL